MKTFRNCWPLCLLSCVLLSAGLYLATAAPAVESGKAKRLFKNPPREYSTGPLWVWNDLLTERQIRETLRDLAKQSVKQAWVHPRPGLMTPYLSPDWFRLWKVALDEAGRLDMNVWIYDENSYPSGFAGGWVPETMPESRGRGLAFRQTNAVPKWGDNFLGVYRLETNEFENVTAMVIAGDQKAEGEYLIASEVRSGDSPWHGNRSYVNLLSPGVTEKFLELTLEPYRREIGDQFGKRVPGVFTDEPNIRPADGWPWSEILLQEFQKRWGYNLLDHLPSLNRPIGDWRRIRHNYFQLLNEQFIEHWSKPYHDYCARNNLEWTGHYWDHDWPKCLGVPDNMAMYAWHQRPAIDCLMNQYEERVDSQFGDVRIVKELSSVANQLGMQRTLCETYGAGGWDLRFEDMKRIGDWLEVLGVNTINQHLSYVTIRGARKRDHPQSFSYHEPWWEAYHVSAQYLARVTAALSQGEQVNPVLLLEPTTTAWMYQGVEPKLKELGNAFCKLEMALESDQVEYDIGSEDVLARNGSVSSAGLRVGNREYRTLVLPPFTETLNEKTLKLLEAFTSAGGTVLSCGPAPARIDGNPSDAAASLETSKHWKRIAADDLVRTLPSQSFAIKRQADDKGILFHHRRQLADGQLLFLVNSSLGSSSAGIIESDLAGVERWNLYTGKTEPYPFERTRTGLKASFELPASGSLMLFLSKKPVPGSPPRTEIVNAINAEGAPVIRRLAENVLALDYVDVTAGDETRTNTYFYQANQFAWQKNGLERDPWDSAVQFKDELISKRFPATSGFEATYRFTIDGPVPTNLAIVIERPDLYGSITCNGQSVQAVKGAWWLDHSFGRISIATVARCGENQITIKASPFTMFHELEPAYVLGNFRLKPADHGFVITPDEPLSLGSSAEVSPGQRSFKDGWNSQGHPFYSAGVAYTETFEVKGSAGRFVVAVPDWYGSVAKVSVNGKSAGYIDAPPWECDVTKGIKAGRNSITVTAMGTLKNTLGPHHGNPVLGAAWPHAFQIGPNPGPPPGNNYSTVAYGLFDPFILKQTVVQRP